MTDFYADADRFLWPITINSANQNLRVVEGSTNLDITLPQSSSLGANEEYYAVASADPSGATSGTTISVLNDADDTLKVRPLYDEIAARLESESSSSGSSLLYQFTAATPSGSSHSNTGIELQQVSDSTNISYDFSINDTVNPRLLGFAEGESGTKGGSSNTITGDFTRWGMWFSQISTSDKRWVGEQETFRSNPDPYRGKTWRFTDRYRVREHTYEGVAGVHVFPDDRASRSAEATRGGLPDNDRNNALYDLWRKATYGDRKILACMNGATDDLAQEVDGTAGKLNVCKLAGDGPFTDMFAPQKQTDRQHAGEKYDLTIKFAVAPDDHYDTTSVSVYQH